MGYWNVKCCPSRPEGEEGNSKQRNQHVQRQRSMKLLQAQNSIASSAVLLEHKIGRGFEIQSI